ncbi:MAG: 6-phosphogluconolactonase [Bacillota bacterium]|nr:6-phosphogluconolactonase [Bacillota bacterium]
MKIITDSKENITKLAADKIRELVAEKPNAAIAFAAGNSFRELFSELEGADFKDVEAFSVCEYIGSDKISHELEAELYSKTGITKIHKPCEEEPEKYDEEIAACGGLDLVVLGIGLNGHIGFNEPATPYDTKTHVQQLTDSTKRMKAELFDGEMNVPNRAVTMGLKTICSAKNVILVAFGEEKAEIVHKLVYGRTETYIPAAMLQLHMNMLLYLDGEAAAKL